MKSIDKEILEIEQRLHQRESRIKLEARQVKQRTLKALVSPASIAGAVALGFFVAGRVGRRKARQSQPVTQQTKEQTKGFALGGLLMTATMWVVKQQFGGPVGLAHFIISKIKNRTKPAPALP
jgi:hypothetical protein